MSSASSPSAVGQITKCPPAKKSSSYHSSPSVVDTRSPSTELGRRRRHRIVRVAVYLELIGAISHLR